MDITGEDIRYLFVKFWCRSYVCQNEGDSIRINCLKYFPDCSKIVDRISGLCWEAKIENWHDIKRIRYLMMVHEPESSYNDWPDKFIRDRLDNPMSCVILTRYKKKDVNLFLDDLIDNLTPDKLYNMKERRFNVTAGIFDELGITPDHRLHSHIVMRQTKNIPLFADIWKVIYSFLRKYNV